MFYTIEEKVNTELIEKKSKFIADLIPISNKEEAEIKIKEIKKKYYDAKHHCFCYITFDKEGKRIERCSDDGEPSGTAGAPMLAVLKGKELCNVLAVVTRYFGGVLLGTGGLVRAYQSAVQEALKKVAYIVQELGKEVKITFPYSEIDNIRYYCRKNRIQIIKEEYLDSVEFLIEIPNQLAKKIKQDFDKTHLKMTKIDIVKEKYIKRNIVV